MKKRVFAFVLLAALVFAATSFTSAQDVTPLTVAGDGGNNQIAWFWFEQEMEAEFGVDLQILGFSFEDLYTKLKTEFVADSGAFDIVVFYPKYLGDFVANGDIISLSPFFATSDPGLNDIVPAFRDLYGKFGSDYYALPYDGDVLALFYRTDLFENADEQAAFQAEFGYPLAVPETWQQYMDVARFFTRDAGETLAGQTLAEPFYGTATYGQRDFQYAWYLNYAASMGFQYFDADMNPLVNSPEAVAALEMYKQEFQYAPPETITFGFDQLQAAFLNGQVAMEIQWTDPGRVGQNPAISQIAGKIGTALVPGTEVNGVVVHKPCMAAGRVIGVTRWADDPAKAYQVARFMAGEASLAYVSSPQSGQDPFRLSHYEAPGAFEMFLNQEQAQQYLDGIRANLENGFPEINIPGAEQYLSVLSIAVNTYVTTDGADAKALLDDVARQWNEITDALGRDNQKALHAQMLEVWKELGLVN
ncbi:MAG: extracellular solute-binding protein [Anaerolineae bacterium]|nr:extracellular solute-binding protein [Anaerolineae bacterium]